MSLLTVPDPPPNRRRPLVVVLTLVVIAGAAYFALTWFISDTERPDSVAARPEAPTPAAPEPEPEPIAPPADSAPDPAPGVEATAPAAPLIPEPRLRVTSDVFGADVFIDRKFVGKTPFESFDVTSGAHQVNVHAPGHESVSYEVTIGSDVIDLDATFAVVRLDARVAVVHKHRVGDCAGELVADLDGIHYRTDDDDAFSVGIHALEEFSVDYLRHNLRLTVRDGRTYNFTDGEANADKLFVFHRDVEKARARLAGAGS